MPAKVNPKDTSEMGSADRWLTENVYNPLYKELGLDYFAVPISSDDSGSTAKQNKKQSQNTFDWTDVVKLHEDSIEKPYSIDKLATSDITHAIPYLEVYRTDEVLFRPYISPYLATSNNVEESSEESDSSSDSDGSSSDSSNLDLNPPQSILKKNEKLSNELKKIVKKYFRKEVNVTTMVARYMDCNANNESISSVTKHSSVWLKLEVTPSTVNEKVLNAKKKYG